MSDTKAWTPEDNEHVTMWIAGNPNTARASGIRRAMHELWRLQDAVAALTAENAGIRQAAIAAWDEQEATMKALRANLLEVTAANERLTGLLDSPGSIATPWPTRSVLTRLADAADHLLRDHNCDHHGYECLNQAVAIARAALPSSRETTDGAN